MKKMKFMKIHYETINKTMENNDKTMNKSIMKPLKTDE